MDKDGIDGQKCRSRGIWTNEKVPGNELNLEKGRGTLKNV